MPVLQQRKRRKKKSRRNMDVQKMQEHIHGKSIPGELKMATYKCFDCMKEVSQDLLRKKVRCPYCGGKILFKPRMQLIKIKAR